MTRLIDAYELKHKLGKTTDKYDTDYLFIDVIADEIDNAPTVDAVEVARCKDCKHRGDYGCPMYHEEYIEWDDDGYRESEIVEHDRTRDDGFCDLGERKDND